MQIHYYLTYFFKKNFTALLAVFLLAIPAFSQDQRKQLVYELPLTNYITKNEASKLENMLLQKSGINSCKVNLETGKVIVTANPGIDSKALTDVVRVSGFIPGENIIVKEGKPYKLKTPASALLMPRSLFEQGGDDITTATTNPVTLPLQTSGSTFGAANNLNNINSSGIISSAYTLGPDWFYYFTAPNTGEITITLSDITSASNALHKNIAPKNFNSSNSSSVSYPYASLTIWDGQPGKGNCIAGGSSPDSHSLTSTINVTAGQSYYVMVDSWSDQIGISYSMSITNPEKPIPNATCTNMDFETGDFTGWTGNSGNTVTSGATGSLRAVYNPGSAGFPSAHVKIVSGAGVETCGGFPIVRPGGSYSAMMGDGTGTGNGGAQLMQTFTVTAATSSLTYWYAVVLQDAKHPDPQQPFFVAEIIDQSGKVIPCGSYLVVAGPRIPGFKTCTTDVYYRAWTPVSVDLSSYIGQTLTLRFTVGDCSQGGHYGYAYVDASCSPMQVMNSKSKICYGESATLTAPPGALGYRWSTGATNQIINVTPLTTTYYTVTLTSVAGAACNTILRDTIFVTPPINVNLTNTNVLCPGTNNGTATTNVSGGVSPPYTYSWNTGQTTPGLTGLGVGFYTVTVTAGGGGCTQTSVAHVINSNGPVITMTNTNVMCAGVNNATATTTVNGANSPFTYIWSNSQTTPNATNLAAGFYTVTVTDKTGCANIETVSITTPTPLVPDLYTTSDPCAPNDSAHIDATGGVPPYQYSWSSGQTTQAVTGLTPGSYTVKITDANGCTKTQAFTIINGIKADFTYPTLCVNTPVTFTNTGTTGTGITYSWLISTLNVSGSSINFSYTFLSAGTYSVQQTISNGTCSNTISKTVTVINCSVPSVTVTSSSTCAGSCVTVTSAAVGGTAPYNYLWNTGETTPTINHCPVSNTTYTLTITDNTGVTATSTSQITINPVVSVSTAPTNVSCNGKSDGTATATGNNGTSPYTYSWNIGQFTQTVSGLAPGTYTVTVTDNKGCTSTSTTSVSEPTVLTTSITPVIINSCSQGSTTATVTPTGGTPGYSYLWSDPVAQTTATATGLTAGTTYTVTVTDSKGCTSTATVSVVSTGNTPVVTAASSGNIDCKVKNVTLTGTSAGNTIVWNGGSLINAPDPATVTTSGIYTVTATDVSTGCTATNTITVTADTIPPPIVATGGNITCIVTSVPLVGTSASGNVIVWNGGPLTNAPNPATVTVPGTYTVTTTNPANGCTASQTVTVAAIPSVPDINVVPANISCTNPSVTLTGTSTTPGVTYQWTGGPASPANTVSVPGIYTITVTDTTNGCTQSQTVNVTSNTTPPDISIATPPMLTCVNKNVTLTGSSLTSNVSYQWSGGQSTDTNTVSVSGVYTLIVTDPDNGCTASQTVTVSDNIVPPNISIAPPTQLTCLANNITLNGNSTTSGVTYQWTSGPSASTYNVSAAGDYTLTVTDPVNGCTATQTITVTANITPPDISIDPPPLLSCTVPNITLSGNSTTAGATFQWNNGPATPANTVSSPGIYTLTVTDPANGCTSTQTTTVIANPGVPDISTTPAQLTCAVTNVTLTGSSNTPGVTFQWNNGPATAAYTVSTAGNYTLTVTDPSNGCTATQTVTVASNTAPPDITIAVPPILTCINTSVTLAGNSITPNVNYQWTGGPATASNTVSTTGIYTLTVSDPGNGCTSTQTITVSDNTAPPDISIAPPSPLTCVNTSVTLNGNSATPAVNYQWTGGPATASNIVATAAIYTLTVTDPANGCTSTQTVTVVSNTTPPDISIDPPAQLSCTVTSVTLTGNSTTSGATFQWTGGPAVAANPVSAAGIYTLTVTDPVNGCTSTQTVTVTASPGVPNISSTPGLITCANPSVTLKGTSTSPGVTFQWTGGPASDTNTVAVAAIYTLTVTDPANGCTASQTVIVTSNTTPPDINIAPPSQLTCTVTSVTLTGSSTTAGATFQWTSGPASDTNSVSSAGVYTLTVTDPANGCISTQSVTVTSSPGVPDISIAPPPQLTCSTTSVALTGGSTTSGVNFQWTSGPAASVNTVSAPGTYTLMVTDPGNGCTASLSVTVKIDTVPPVLNPASSGTITCVATSVTLSGNSPGNTIVWNGGTLNNSPDPVTVTAPGTYTATVTDAGNGCSATQTITVIASPGVPNVSIASPPPLTCSNTSVTLTGSSTTPGVTYQWVGGPAAPSNNVSSANTYTLIVTDTTNGCTATQQVTVTSNTTPPTVTAKSSGRITCTITSVNLIGTSIGSSMVWNGGTLINAPDPASVTVPGIYTVTATDTINGCTATQTVTVTQPPGITLTATSTNTLCGGTNGTATAHVRGGTLGYTYLWDNLQTDSTATGLLAGTYTVTATDAYGCSATSAVIVTDTNTFVLSIVPARQNITSGSSVAINVSGGVAYTWTPADGLSCSDCPNPIASPTITTTYTVIATDLKGCTVTAMMTITVKRACEGNEEDIFIANIFSPNNDGKNDKLFVQGNGLKDIYWAIYDRWGNLLFEAFDQAHGWDGTRKGNPMESGVYVYYLKATCIATNTDVKIKGNVAIVK